LFSRFYSATLPVNSRKQGICLQNMGGGTRCSSFAVISRPTVSDANLRLSAGRLIVISTPARIPWLKRKAPTGMTSSSPCWRFFVFPNPALLWHTCSHGKQRQRQKRSQEGAQAEAQAGTRAETRRIHAGPAEVGENRPPHRRAALETRKGFLCLGGSFASSARYRRLDRDKLRGAAMAGARHSHLPSKTLA